MLPLMPALMGGCTGVAKASHDRHPEHCDRYENDSDLVRDAALAYTLLVDGLDDPFGQPETADRCRAA